MECGIQGRGSQTLVDNHARAMGCAEQEAWGWGMNERNTLPVRFACKSLALLEALNIMPKLPAIQNWWLAHKVSDAAKGIKSGGGGC